MLARPPSSVNRGHGEGRCRGLLPPTRFSPLLTLHGLDKVPDGVRPDTESRTLLHELGWDVAVRIKVVHGLRVQLH